MRNLSDLFVWNPHPKKETYKLFAKFLTINPCVIEKYIVNVTYVVNDNRLGYFISEKQTHKITAEFNKVTPVKPFINCSIRCHTTFTWNKSKLVDKLSTIFSYIITKISRKWRYQYSENWRVAVYVPLSVFDLLLYVGIKFVWRWFIKILRWISHQWTQTLVQNEFHPNQIIIELFNS